MAQWNEHFDRALDFIEQHGALVDCHLVDFIVKNLWEKCLPAALRLELESLETSESSGKSCDIKKLKSASLELSNFFKRIENLSLKDNPFVTKLNEFSSSAWKIDGEMKNNGKLMNFMSDKKQHEIEILSRLVGHLTRENEINLVIDAGAGKGYLSTNISQNYGISVLAIDSSEINVKGAINRGKMIMPKKNDRSDLVRYSVRHIDDKTDYPEIVRSQFDNWDANDNCLLTGLHTCGHLAHSMIRQFLRTDCLKSLCVVPCCYHLTEDSLTGDCNLTKNARMIAQQSVERNESKDVNDSRFSSLFYRALLQIILQALGIPDARIGRKAPTKDFPTYANWAFMKIGVEQEKIPSMEDLNRLHQSHLSFEWKLNVFQLIRIHVGSVVEAALILDRVVHMQNSNRCSKIALIKLFDPVISPRCYAIVASKK